MTDCLRPNCFVVVAAAAAVAAAVVIVVVVVVFHFGASKEGSPISTFKIPYCSQCCWNILEEKREKKGTIKNSFVF